MTAAIKYREALALYRDTDLSVTEISRRCGVGRSAFAAYIQRNFRALMFRRRGIGATDEEAGAERLHSPKGQRPLTEAKYGEAVEACRSRGNLQFNISEIARRFRLSPTGLGNHLRRHFPDVIEWREAERRLLGLADNKRRGASRTSEEQYAAAMEDLASGDVSIREAAQRFGVSYSGLREHVLLSHRDVAEKREQKRSAARGVTKTPGALTGNGKRHVPSPADAGRYAEAVRLFRETSLPESAIAAQLGISGQGFRNHMRLWHRDLLLRSRGADPTGDTPLSATKKYRRSSAEKYASAIARLRESNLTTAEVAREFGFNPDVFRQYLREHEPELAASRGRKKSAKGKSADTPGD